MTNPITQSATRLRIGLVAALFLSVIVIVGVVVYGVRFLDNYALEVNQTVAEAASSDERLSTIRSQASLLEKHDDALQRAKQIVAESQSYLYQDAIIKDIEAFARKAGVSVVSYDFTAQASDTATETPAATDGALSAPEGAEAGPAASSSALKSTFVNVSIESPVDYRRLLRFMYYIEQNLTKMQIANVSLSGDENSGAVTTNTFTIEVYIR